MQSADIAFVVFAFMLLILVALLIQGITREARQRAEEEKTAFLREYPGLTEELARERRAARGIAFRSLEARR
ncbi:hypothetical protein [Ramlibacter tataouinensis]|nr:hypothetical protein [Ramlibacter tataouinensis]